MTRIVLMPTNELFETALRERVQSQPFIHGKELFQLHDTFGLPFDIMLDEINKSGIHADVGGLRAELKACYGWSDSRVNTELRGF
jgi:alanyl-tRNA synthetase